MKPAEKDILPTEVVDSSTDEQTVSLRSIIDEARDIVVEGARRTDYGSPVESFHRIAALATVLIGKDITPSECCKVMLSVKLIREAYSHKRDNLVDLIGYAEILNQIEETAVLQQ